MHLVNLNVNGYCYLTKDFQWVVFLHIIDYIYEKRARYMAQVRYRDFIRKQILILNI